MKNLLALSVVGCVAGMAGQAWAEFPEDKNVTLVIPFGAGGSTDLVGRLLAKQLETILGQTVVATNQTGGAGTIGTAAVADAAPDGYTIGYVPQGPLVMQPHRRNLPYDIESFEYICRVTYDPAVLLTGPDTGIESIDDLVERARTNPGQVVYVAVDGGLPQIAMQAFADSYGIDMKFIPGDYATAARYIGSNTAQVMVGQANIIEQFGLKPLAVFSDERVESFGGVPTLAENGHDVLLSFWYGLVTSKGTPADVVAQLSDACAGAVRSEEFVEAMGTLHAPISYQGGSEFESFVKAQYDEFGRYIQPAAN